MSTTYQKADDDLVRFVDNVMIKHHWRLKNAGVTVSVLTAEAGVDEAGNRKGPAMKTRGHAVEAKIRIVGIRDRVKDVADAELIIDFDRWPLRSMAQRVALIDHEFTHLDLVHDDGGRVKRDDHGRPKMRIRPHDVEIGWFVEVAERHGRDSIEVEQAQAIVERERQTVFAFLGEPAEQKPLSLEEVGKNAMARNPKIDRVSVVVDGKRTVLAEREGAGA